MEGVPPLQNARLDASSSGNAKSKCGQSMLQDGDGDGRQGCSKPHLTAK